MNDTSAPLTTDTDGWEDPLPLGWRTDLPAFPVETLPGVLGEYASALAEATQTPPDLAGCVVLGVVSGCIAGRVRVWARPGWTEPTNLWTVPVLPSGSRKSAVVDAASSPLLDAEELLRESIAGARRDAATEKSAREKFAAQLLNAASKDCDPAALAEAQKAAAEAEAILVPAWPQLTVDDSTPEALVSVLADQGGRVVAISAEAGLFETLAGARYSARSKVEALLKAHAGDTIRVNRQMREPQLVRRPALTLISTIQPYALRQLVANDEYAGRGLLQRVLWSLPPDNVGYRTVGAPPVDDDLAERYRQMVIRLAVRMASTGDAVLLKLTRDAAAEHLRYETQIEEMLRPDGPLGTTELLRSWGSKLAGASLRIAAVLHVAADPSLGDLRIGADAIRAAVQLAEYYRAHADAALHPADDQAADDARSLLRWLTRRPSPRFSDRDVRRGAPRRFRGDPAVARRTLAVLAELGWCRAAAAGGWELHPQAAEHLSACDTCDTDPKSAGQGRRTAGDSPSHPRATRGDNVRQSPDHVAPRRTTGRHHEADSAPASTSKNAGTVAAVARVARGQHSHATPERCDDCGHPENTTAHAVACGLMEPAGYCRVCAGPLDPVLSEHWRRELLHPSCEEAPTHA